MDEVHRAVDLGGKSVLIVDANRISLRVLNLQLTALKMVIVAASTPADAFTALAGGRAFDVIVLGNEIPQMDGLGLAAALRRVPSCAATPMVLLIRSGDRLPRSAGFAAIITKPVERLALKAALEASLHSAGSHIEAERYNPAAIKTEEHPLRILLAEDNVVNQRVGRLMLENLGHSVDIVSNGYQAVEAVTRVIYDVVLMDLQMPEVDGLAATRQIRANVAAERQPQIIALTARALPEDQRNSAAAGMDNYLTKPVRLADLKQLLDDVRVAIRQRGLGAVETSPPPPPTG